MNNYDYIGGDIGEQTDVQSSETCAKLCKSQLKCKAFTFWLAQNKCFFKSKGHAGYFREGFNSGVCVSTMGDLPAMQPSPNTPGCYYMQHSQNALCNVQSTAVWIADTWGKTKESSWSSEENCFARKAGHEEFCGAGISSTWLYVPATTTVKPPTADSTTPKRPITKPTTSKQPPAPAQPNVFLPPFQEDGRSCKRNELRTTKRKCKGYCHGGGIGWADSFAVNTEKYGKICYCKTTFDHDIGDATINTPAGCKNMRQVCQDIEDKYGPAPTQGREYYNSVQCGHPPYNQHVGLPDERPDYCPGRTDDGGKGCQDIGPAFDLNFMYGRSDVPATKHDQPFNAVDSPKPVATSCTIEPGVDYFGGDIGVSFYAASAQHCAQACEQDLQCRFFTYMGSTCYLKNSGAGRSIDQNGISGACPGAPVTDTMDARGWAARAGLCRTADGGTGTVLVPSGVGSLRDCKERCERTRDCKGIEHEANSNYCELHMVATPNVAAPGSGSVCYTKVSSSTDRLPEVTVSVDSSKEAIEANASASGTVLYDSPPVQPEAARKYPCQQFVRSQFNPVVSVPRQKILAGNANGPSLIKLPSWIKNKLGKYYMYFGHHDGKQIQMAYSNAVEGPYTVYEPGTLQLSQTPMGGTGYGHIASPDIHVDEATQTLMMVYHIGGINQNTRLRDEFRRQGCDNSQVSLLAQSKNGIDWTTTETCLGQPYMRVFRHGGRWRGVARHEGSLALFSAPGNGQTLSGRFTRGPTIAVPGMKVDGASCTGIKMRHTAVHLSSEQGALNTLNIYYSAIGHQPEHIQKISVDLGAMASKWNSDAVSIVSSPPDSVLHPTENYEGGNLPSAASVCGAVYSPVRQLRDPHVYEDTLTGTLHLIYSVAGEQGLAVASKSLRCE